MLLLLLLIFCVRFNEWKLLNFKFIDLREMNKEKSEGLGKFDLYIIGLWR